jgi:hypothetical protein
LTFQIFSITINVLNANKNPRGVNNNSIMMKSEINSISYLFSISRHISVIPLIKGGGFD